MKCRLHRFIATCHLVAPLVGAWIEIDKIKRASTWISVAPLVGAWIEIVNALQANFENLVAPLVGAWIEIPRWCPKKKGSVSLPSWERGLKFPPPKNSYLTKHVAPLVGAWIEIYNHFELIDEKAVAPLVGAWIEITNVPIVGRTTSSLPSWERGLKY